MKQKILNELKKVKRKGMNDLIKWLLNTDFFVFPASRSKHLCETGGLAKHSWNVYLLLKEKNKRYNLNLNKDTIIICGLLHDVCKVNCYMKTEKSADKYVYCNDKFPIGHGEKSVIFLMRYINLTDQEIQMIYWHTSVHNITEKNKEIYYQAIRLYPECLAMYTADYEATVFLEHKLENLDKK